MQKTKLSIIFLFFIFSSLVCGQNFSKTDSLIIKNTLNFNHKIAQSAERYVLTQAPAGYSLQLIGSDNKAVISSTGKKFQPLHTVTVNLLVEVMKIADNSSMEISVPVVVEGKYKDAGNNPKPFVIPSLREWYGTDGEFKLTPKSKIVIDPRYKTTLKEAAKIFQAELETLSSLKLKVSYGQAQAGDIYITLDGDSSELGKEGYYLTVKDFVEINAADYKGAFGATRSLLQILEQDDAHNSIAQGIARDYPKYEVRGFMLNVGRKYFSIDFLRDYVKLMSYYKINNFQIHLNDNAFVKHFDNKWEDTYSGFRLESSTYPQLPTKGEFYTKKEFIDLQILAEQYAVDIIPEIDVPAHSLAFTKAFPQISSKEYGADHLDINHPETYEIIENVFKEYLEGKNPVFRNNEVHIGTDEYAKKEAESFRKFTDHFIQYIQSFGKQARVWGALTHAQGTTPVTNKGVTMNAWYNGYADPIEMKKQGYPLISTPDGMLYIVPAAGYYYDYLNLKYIYNSWEPVNIGNVTFKMGDPFVRGGMFAVWNDVANNGITAQDVTDRAFPAVQVLAQKMWNGANETLKYEEFASNAKAINETPGLNLRAKHSPNESVVMDYKLSSKSKELKYRKIAFVEDQNTKVLQLKSNKSTVTLPIEEIGYNYTVNFKINPTENNANNAVIFQSEHASFKLKQNNTNFIGFSREGKDYDFGISVTPNRWTTVTVTGDNNSTSLYLDGKLAKKLTREQITIGENKEKIWVMKTLFFPLRTIGDKENAFVGKMKDLKVFNHILSDQQIEDLNNAK